MKVADKNQIIYTLFKTNILPVTSLCNTTCIFCSHKQNPKEIEVYKLPSFSMEDYEEMISYLSSNKKIVIGESATRIVEGEPFANKDFIKILSLVRQKHKTTPIQITTNGIMLTEDSVNTLFDLGYIELNVSVNAVNPILRKKILGTPKGQNIEEKILLLKDKIKFSGSMVWVPEIMKYRDVEEVISLLAENGADNVRIFLPGITAVQNHLKLALRQVYEEMQGFIEAMREKYPIPILVEPSYISNLDCKVEGVIQNSPAHLMGIERGDRIVSINGIPPKTRVDAFNKVYALRNPVVGIERQNNLFDIKLQKQKNTSPGFIVLYDLDPEIAFNIQETVKRYDAKRVLFVTSELAFQIIQSFISGNVFPFEYELLKAENRFFGGTIKCAGLLTVKDIQSAIEEHLKKANRPELILLPPSMFDHHKKDLLGESIHAIEEQFGIPVDTV